MTMGQLRAHQADEKQARRQEILAAAAELWPATSFADFRMATLAAHAGLAKGTLYLYFSSKEHLFLALLEQSLYPWLERLGRRLAAQRRPTPVSIARLFTDAFAADPTVDRLLPLLESVLEHSIDAPTALAFKQRLLTNVTPLALALEQTLPCLDRRGLEAVILIRALHSGYRQMADSAPVVQQVLAERAELAPLRVDFHRGFQTALARALAGYTQAL
jgi:TetR/AcrR family transcriptional regulator, cholesterol catabolism regulator